MLHVLNGDATRMKLEPSGVPGEMSVWADALHEGPVPDLPAGELRQVRAAHWARLLDADEPDIARIAQGWDDALDTYAAHDEVIFWFEHDLFDQLALVRHLHWLSTIDRGRTRFSLICIGSYPGVDNFTGLGPLSPGQLATLFPSRVPISETQIATGRDVWNRFRAADPRPLAEWVATAGSTELPFLPGALRRHLEDFPWLRDGLARSERQILQAVAAGAGTFAQAFGATARMEERAFMGDTTFLSIVRRLAGGRTPLLTVANPEVEMIATGLALTDAGRSVLAGEADYVRMNGIDRWMGGAHLLAGRHWRWDGARLRLSIPNP